MKLRILVVMMLLAMLTSVTFAQDKEPIEDENAVKIKKTAELIQKLNQPLKEYAQNHPYGMFPEASDEEEGNGTAYLVESLREGNFYVFSDENLTKDEPYQLVDAWGVPMRYHPWKGKKVKTNSHNKKTYDLWSAGPDGEFDTGDEVANFQVTPKAVKEIQNQVIADTEAIKKMFEEYFKAINTYEVEKSSEFYYVPRAKEAEFKKSLQSQMDSMKKMYGDKEFVRNFEIVSVKFQDRRAELTYTSEFYLIEDKKWSKSESTLTLVKINGKWKIDIYGVYKIDSVEEKWVSVAPAMQSIIDAIGAFKKDSGSLEVLATDVWKPISHIMGAIKLDSDILSGLTYFDLEDFHYITRKIEGVYFYRVICIGWGSTKGGRSGDGPQVGYKLYDSEKNEFFEDFKANSFDGLGKARIEITDAEPRIEEKKVEIDEEVKTEIKKVVDGFFTSVNKFDSVAIQEFIYIQEDLREKAVARLNEIFELLKKESRDKDGNYVKDWEIVDLNIEGAYAVVVMRFNVYIEGSWQIKSESYNLIKIDGKWLVNFFGLNPEDEKPQTRPADDEELQPDNPVYSEINSLIDEYYKSFNATDEERVLECIYMPENKKEECKKNIKLILDEMRSIKVPEGYSLFKDWIINNIEITGDKAIATVEYSVFQDAENGYYEDSSEWLCVKVGDKWVVDLFRYSDKELTEEEWLRQELEKLEKENEQLRKQNTNLKKQNKNLRKKVQNQQKQIEKLKSNENKPEEKSEDESSKSEVDPAKAKVDSAKAMIKILYNTVQRYKMMVGVYPESLENLINGPDDFEGEWKSMLCCNEEALIDPWGYEYQMFEDENGDIIIVCFGADGSEGGEGYDKDLQYPPAELDDEKSGDAPEIPAPPKK